MSSQISKQNEPDENLVDKLQDLEQHISQRISRLGDELPPLPSTDDDELPAVADYLSTYEPMDQFDFENPADPLRPQFGTMYRPPVTASYDGVGEVMRAVHDLSDLLTESVLNLNIRLATLEDRLSGGVPAGSNDVQKALGEIKRLIGSTARGGPDQSMAGDQGINSDITRELQLQVKLIEEYINRSSADIKQRVDDRAGNIREQLDTRAKVLEKMASETKDYLNRHFFSLAILLIILLFISSALITSSIDRLSGYLSEQSDAIHLQIDQLSTSLHAKIEQK